MPQATVIREYPLARTRNIGIMAHIGADFGRSVDMIRDRLDAKPAVVQIPIGAEGHFRGCIDLIGQKALVWEEGMGERWSVEDIPADMVAAAEAAHHDLIDVVSEFDDGAMEKYVGDEEISPDDLRRALRQGTIANTVATALSGTGL